MRLTAATRLGPYEVVSALGAGGMGEVYRARDTRLGRDVALKVLPLSRYADPDLLARFEREATLLAALNHPHIAALYDVIDVGDQRALVMELVVGSTLADVIAQGGVPLPTAIGCAIDICDALSAAHAAGIVHRDLKPENIIITENGSAKLVDFGIAKAAMASGGDAGASTRAALTGELALVGTIRYMSPEQANGRQVDARSDIFSLGVVLHEMISRRPAFDGDTAAAILSAVLRDDPPPLRTIVPTTPRAVERCVTRCLAKDSRRRFQSATDLKAILEDLREDLTSSGTLTMSPDRVLPAPVSIGRRLARAAVFVAGGLLLVAFGMFAAAATRAPSVLVPSYRPFITDVAFASNPVWSPDGRTLAYMDTNEGHLQIFVRGVDAVRSTSVTKEAATIGLPAFWSPDGSRLYFVRAGDGDLVSVGVGGGEPQLVAKATEPGNEGRQNSQFGGIRACMSPDGRTIVFSRGQEGGVQLWVLDIRTNDTHTVDVAGMPRPLLYVQALAFSPDGATLAMLASTTALNQSRGIWLIPWPGGPARHVMEEAPYLATTATISWMPDNRRIVMSGSPIQSGTNRLLMADIAAATLSPLTGGKDDEGGPTVSPDGDRIAFVSHRSGMDLIQLPMDGSPPEPLLATSRSESNPDLSDSGILAYETDADGYTTIRIRTAGDTWTRTIGGSNSDRDRAIEPTNPRLSRDGQRVAVNTYSAEHLIWIYPTAGGTPVRLDSQTTDQHGPSWSPDGNWIAYRRLIKGQWEIVKAPVGGGAVVRLDDAAPGGGTTDWSAAGQWIAHGRPDGIHLVSPDGISKRLLAGLLTNGFRFSHDGTRLYALRRGEKRRWELSIWDVATLRELRSVALPLASAANVQGLALSLDEKRIILAAGTDTSDIWLLEHFEPPPSPWARWLRR
jgi:Tol biopolymer transport system component/tRNA A-37 threonylcarbamoyl transferase component Bud32